MNGQAPQQIGQVLGVGGSGLVDASWAASKRVAQIGRTGEVRTAGILNDVARTPGGPTVLHHITPEGSDADVDHVLVAGTRVHMIDTKVWKPAVYWSMGGIHRRSVSLMSHEVVEHAPDYGAIERARGRMQRTLEHAGVGPFELVGPFYVVWSSSESKPVTTTFLNLGPGTTVIPGQGLLKAARRMGRGGTASPRIVEALARLKG